MSDVATNNNPADDSFTAKLKQYRAEIDMLDEEMTQLILKRSQVVNNVGRLKESAGEKTCPLRPAREAAQLKKLMDRFEKEAFPAAAAAHVWRNIINGSLAIETKMTIGVCSPVGTTSDMVWMAREYFGAYAEVIRESQPKVLVNKVANDQCTIGVLPYPNSEDTNPWWLDLAHEAGVSPTIFLKLPFLPGQAAARSGGSNVNPQAFAIAKVTSEAFGASGITAIAIRAESTLSMSKLQEAFRRANFNAKWISVSALSEMERAHFVEVEGDLSKGDARLEAIREYAGEGLTILGVIGQYAKSLMEEEAR